MESYQICDLTFFYPERNHPALEDINLTIQKGEFLLLCGQSGCGKSTLLRQLKPILSSHGTKQGEIFFEGVDITVLDQQAQAAKIGFVLQSPDNQIVTDKVWHELAFGLESLGQSTAVIRTRVAEMASFFGIESWFYQSVSQLSGGQKQLLNLAAVMAMQPSVLILDEPTSQLDPIAASDFLATVGKINRELGVTVIMTEHRLEDALPLCDRAVVMEQGRIIADGTPLQVGKSLRQSNHGMFSAFPTPMRIWAGVENTLLCPVTVREGRQWLDSYLQGREISEEIPPVPEAVHHSLAALELREVFFRYEKDAPDILKGMSLTVGRGELFALVGGNGSGKTTALSLLAGLNKPQRGEVFINGENIATLFDGVKYQGLLGTLPQNPQALFVCNTVKEDLWEILSDRGLSKSIRQDRIAAMVKLCRLEDLLQSHPYDLSGGEQQRAALAKVLLLEPQILLLDEPTKGMDARFKEQFARLLGDLTASGTTVFMVSHDIEFCAEYAHRVAMCFDGCIVSQGKSKAFFTGNSFYTTAANRMAREHIPSAATAGDVIKALGGKTRICPLPPPLPKDHPPSKTLPQPKLPQDKGKLSKRTLAAMVMVLLAIPLTIFAGIYFFGDRKYYFISLLVMLETMLPFAIAFEGRKPQARELVVIAVLCAIGVAGRGAFFMLPHFKPVVAIVIVAGVAFGGEAGFLVGTMTGFVSNFFFGQGPWTPWQMFAFGIIGFLAGVLFRKGLLRRHKVILSIFGGLTAFVIYGGIMNPASVLMYQANPTAEMFLLAYLRGIPVDLVHSIATVFFLLIAADPLLEKLDRIKVKYGLIDV